jgi:hypothetical protein
MRYLSRVAPSATIFGLLAGAGIVLTFLPSKEELGSVVDRVASWMSPAHSRSIQGHEMGPVKQRLFRHIRSGRTALDGRDERTTQRQPDGDFKGTS